MLGNKLHYVIRVSRGSLKSNIWLTPKALRIVPVSRSHEQSQCTDANGFAKQRESWNLILIVAKNSPDAELSWALCPWRIISGGGGLYWYSPMASLWAVVTSGFRGMQKMYLEARHRFVWHSLAQLQLSELKCECSGFDTHTSKYQTVTSTEPTDFIQTWGSEALAYT